MGYQGILFASIMRYSTWRHFTPSHPTSFGVLLFFQISVIVKLVLALSIRTSCGLSQPYHLRLTVQTFKQLSSSPCGTVEVRCTCCRKQFETLNAPLVLAFPAADRGLDQIDCQLQRIRRPRVQLPIISRHAPKHSNPPCRSPCPTFPSQLPDLIQTTKRSAQKLR
ncbi:hypothetical protein GE09DRAFT_212668 [Coniochaeta sp. 2T2.1]|nr:hypothetical protein GE09DRAFT_212668 [Coniochaeta sp. 2T2.1]